MKIRLISEFDKNEASSLEEAISAAARASIETTEAKPAGVCGRVYVNVGPVHANSWQGKLLAQSFKMTRRPQCSYKQIYVGYDNATGAISALGAAIALSLNASGVSAYVDGGSD